jgi:hypothetical protein
MCSCTSSSNQHTKQTKSTTIKQVDKKSKIDDLKEGVIEYDNDVFGEIINLTGVDKDVDKPFKIKRVDLMVNDNKLIVNTGHVDYLIRIIDLTNYHVVKELAPIGNGPDEFQFVNLVKDESGEFLCYFHDIKKNKLYSISKNYEVKEAKLQLPKGDRMYYDNMVHISNSDVMYYTTSMKKNKSVCKLNLKSDNGKEQKLFDMAISKKHNNWVACKGCFGANHDKKRIVLGYQYFKKLVFIDTESKKVKRINFKSDYKIKSKKGGSLMDPNNRVYYCRLTTTNDFVYLVNVESSPAESHKRSVKGKPEFIYVEKFDWNGNPIAKYKLDDSGFICYDEKRNLFILSSMYNEAPFREFRL